VPERAESVRVAGVAGRGLGLVILLILAWKVLAQGLTFQGGTRQWASAAVTLVWTGQSLTDVAIYAADGRAEALPRLAEGLIHHWNFVLGRLGLLQSAETIGRLIFGVGLLTMLAALLLLALDLLRRWNAPPAPAETGLNARAR